MAVYTRVTNFLRNTFQDRFRRYLIISLAVLGILVGVTTRGTAGIGEGLEIHFFYLTGCPHCDEQRPFNDKLRKEYPAIPFIEHDATSSEEYALLQEMLSKLEIEDEPEFPITVITISTSEELEGWIYGGWVSNETTGKTIEDALQKCLAGSCPPSPGKEPDNTIVLPFFGEIDPAHYSLLTLAVILGLVDGFNPCAMWVLVYLVSLVVTLRDRRRIWLIVGAFVLASGILYFIFMTMQYAGFRSIGNLGYVKPVTIMIGLIALGGGILQVKETIETKGAIVCKVTDEESRKKTMTKAQRIVASPITVGTIAGIIALAFAVNTIEFACSWMIPTAFTGALAQASITTFQPYAFILLYVFFFMLDDAVIFGTAAFAVTSTLGERYAKYSRPVGATILIILGILLLTCLYSAQFSFLRPVCRVFW